MNETTDDAVAQRDDAIRATGTDPDTGFAHDGDWPVNGRLRAEALSRAGIAVDPSDIVTPDLIHATGERLAAEDAARAEDEAKVKAATPSLDWTRDKLADHAEGAGIEVASGANKADILSAIEAAPGATPNTTTEA